MTIRGLFLTISKIDGWLSSHEGYFLYKMARETNGNVVEIGSWKGKSTICLAEGLEKNGKVFAIDPHEGKYTGGRKSPTFKSFEKNLKVAGVFEKVKPIIATSENAARKWKDSISFLFIDGLHDYEHASQDFSLWSPLLKKRGVIALHDAFCGHDGPERVIMKEILRNNKWSDIGVIGSIIYARKEKPTSLFQKFNIIRHRFFISQALALSKSNLNQTLKFFLIHRIIKLFLINRYTFALAFYEKV